MSNFKGKVAVVGIGEVPSGKFPDRPCLQNALEACREAILDAGIEKDEIDTIIPTGTFFDRRYNTKRFQADIRPIYPVISISFLCHQTALSVL